MQHYSKYKSVKTLNTLLRNGCRHKINIGGGGKVCKKAH